MKNFIMPYAPSVCAVGNDYVICVPIKRRALVYIAIGADKYYYHNNGIRISKPGVHMFRVPQKQLNQKKRYSVHIKPCYARLPFATVCAPEKRFDFKFTPVTKTEGINICHISDCHGSFNAPVEAGSYFGGDLDMLILNGDIQNFSQTVSQSLLPYKISSQIARGRLPVIITRGNHDLRGTAAQQLDELYPTDNGNFYYAARVGCMEFLVADCGEDKADTHKEYGETAAYHPFRREETNFIKRCVQSDIFFKTDIKYRFILCHVPFSVRNQENWGSEKTPFDIENDLYCEWCDLIRRNIRPKLFISGHFHEYEVIRKNAGSCTRGPLRDIGCDTLIGGMPVNGKKDFISANITVNDDGCEIVFCDRKRQIPKKENTYD